MGTGSGRDAVFMRRSYIHLRSTLLVTSSTNHKWRRYVWAHATPTMGRTSSVFRKGNIVNCSNNGTTIKRHDIKKKASPLLLSSPSRSLSERKIFV